MKGEPNLLSQALMPDFRQEVEKLALCGSDGDVRTLARVLGMMIDEIENLSVIKSDNPEFFGPAVPVQSNTVVLQQVDGFVKRLLRRIWGRSYPARDMNERQLQHGRRGSHLEVEWTTPEHWAHNNYERTHLPQLCVVASGWKARLIALILVPKAPFEPYQPNS